LSKELEERLRYFLHPILTKRRARNKLTFFLPFDIARIMKKNPKQLAIKHTPAGTRKPK